MIRCVIFDFDGTLAKTMEDHFAAWAYAFKKHGIAITRDEYFPCEGMRMILTAEHLSRLHNIHADAAMIVNDKVDYYLRHHSFEWYPDAVEIVDWLAKKGVPLALVTGSTRKQLEIANGDTLDKFTVIVTADDITKGKPDPEPFHKAMIALGMKPEECLVIENAPLGITAAKSAGMHCIAIASTVKRNKLSAADSIVEQIADLRTHPLITSIITA